MSSRLADRLMQARRAYFVGRAPECSLLRSALCAPELPFLVLYIYGPGGIGKSTLLHEYRYLCEEHGARVLYLDGREMEPTPASFQSALAMHLGLSGFPSSTASAPSIRELAEQTRDTVLLLDTFEQLAGLEGWLRTIFLPQLSDSNLTIIASRTPPSAQWRADIGWQALLRTLPLRNLSPEEGREYLNRRGVPRDEHGAILDFTYSYPLALSLVAEVFAQRKDVQFAPGITSDVVRDLLERLVQKVPSPAHRAALEACAMIRVTNESLLARMLALPDARELFDWLRSLSFITANLEGLLPHELVRDALSRDLRWRNPDWYRELHNRARAYFMERLEQTRGVDQQRVLVDYVYLHRDNPAVRPFLDWEMRDSGLLADTLQPGDIPHLLRMVEEHEGQQSAHFADYWLAHQPAGVTVYRRDSGEPLGFLSMVALHALGSEQPGDLPGRSPVGLAIGRTEGLSEEMLEPGDHVDPAIQAIMGYLRQHESLRYGERGTLFRFWMDKDTYQAVSAVQSMAFITIIQHYLTTPGLALTFIPCADPAFWHDLLEYANISRLPEADFQVGGTNYGVFYHDWRIEPPIAWLDMLAARETGMEASPGPIDLTVEPLLVLSEPDFATALRDALRCFALPDQLRSNPLLRSRLIHVEAGPDAVEDVRIEALRDLLLTTAESFQRSPRQTKFYRALERTYFEPAATQEAAAELLDLPFSTYRRHLRSGIERMVEILWNAELKSA